MAVLVAGQARRRAGVPDLCRGAPAFSQIGRGTQVGCQQAVVIDGSPGGRRERLQPRPRCSRVASCEFQFGSQPIRSALRTHAAGRRLLQQLRGAAPMPCVPVRPAASAEGLAAARGPPLSRLSGRWPRLPGHLFPAPVPTAFGGRVAGRCGSPLPALARGWRPRFPALPAQARTGPSWSRPLPDRHRRWPRSGRYDAAEP